MSKTARQKRLTIAFSNKRKPLETVLREEQKQYPKANAKLSGSPGKWQVTRDVVDGDDLTKHRARNMVRYL